MNWMHPPGNNNNRKLGQNICNNGCNKGQIPERWEAKKMSPSTASAYCLENLQIKELNLTISIITLNVNGINTPIKARRNYVLSTRNTLNLKTQTG